MALHNLVMHLEAVVKSFSHRGVGGLRKSCVYAFRS